MTIALLVAMSSEWHKFNALLNESTGITVTAEPDETGKLPLVTGTLGENKILLAQTGIGKVNAALTAQEIIHHYHPDCVISSGVAGSLTPAVQVMDVVLASSVVYHDVDCGEGNAYGQVQGLPPRFPTDPKLLAALSAAQLPSAEQSLHTGLIASGDIFVQTQEAMDKIRAAFPEALAVDMESGALAHTCYLLKTPFISFRIISDSPGANQASLYKNFWQTLADKAFANTRALLETMHNA